MLILSGVRTPTRHKLSRPLSLHKVPTPDPGQDCHNFTSQQRPCLLDRFSRRWTLRSQRRHQLRRHQPRERWLPSRQVWPIQSGKHLSRFWICQALPKRRHHQRFAKPWQPSKSLAAEPVVVRQIDQLVATLPSDIWCLYRAVCGVVTWRNTREKWKLCYSVGEVCSPEEESGRRRDVEGRGRDGCCQKILGLVWGRSCTIFVDASLSMLNSIAVDVTLPYWEGWEMFSQRQILNDMFEPRNDVETLFKLNPANNKAERFIQGHIL